MYWYEILFAEMVSQFILPTDQFPLQTPFQGSTMHNEMSDSISPIWCSDCQSSSLINVTEVKTDFDKWRDKAVTEKRMNAIALTDCPNAYASISSIAANSQDRSMRIILCYIRDNAATMCLSFLDACFNLADSGTKQYSNRVIYHEFVKSGRLRISFLGRKVVEQLKVAGVDMEKNKRGMISLGPNKSVNCFAPRPTRKIGLIGYIRDQDQC